MGKSLSRLQMLYELPAKRAQLAELRAKRLKYEQTIERIKHKSRADQETAMQHKQSAMKNFDELQNLSQRLQKEAKEKAEAHDQVSSSSKLS